MIRKLSMAGMKSFRICLSIASFAGKASFQKFTPSVSGAAAASAGSASAGSAIATAAAAGRGVEAAATRRRAVVDRVDTRTRDGGTPTAHRALTARGAGLRARGASTRAATASGARATRAIAADIIVIGNARAHERPKGVRACASATYQLWRRLSSTLDSWPCA
jgi:hypothetical protein